MEKIKKICESIKLKWLRETSLTLILIAIIIVAFIGINIGIEKLNLTDIDLTSEKLYTVTDTSKEQLAKIPDDEKIEIYLFGYIENSSVVDLVKQYVKLKENISMEITSVTDRKDLVSQYDIDEEDSTILIVSGDKHKAYGYNDLFTMDYNTGNTIDITEQRITNGILSVSSIGKITPIYVLTGHEEYSTSSALVSLKTYLELENYELKDLDLLIEEKVPDDCEAIIVASPKKDFTELEAEKIKDYINAGGNILWMNDTFSAVNTDGTVLSLPNIQSILDLYGVTIEQDGIILEQDTSKMAMQSPDVILPNIEYSEVAGSLSSEGKVMFLDSSRLKFVEDTKFEELKVVKTDLLTTSNEAFYRKDLSLTSISLTEKDEVGTQVIGASFEKTINDETKSKLIVYANNAFATDAAITVGQQKVPAIYFYNNLDLVVNSVGYLAEAEEISISKNIEVVNYTATEAQNNVVMAIIFGVPVLIVIVGIVVWQLRRRKQ